MSDLAADVAAVSPVRRAARAHVSHAFTVGVRARGPAADRTMGAVLADLFHR